MSGVREQVASIHASVAYCDMQIAKIKELDKWRKYNKRTLRQNKRDGIALYERTDLAIQLILRALPAHDENKYAATESEGGECGVGGGLMRMDGWWSC